MTENVMFHYPKWEDGTKTGHTICIINYEGRTFIGSALCSVSDNFCYETGRKIASVRATEALHSFIEKRQSRVNVMQAEVQRMREGLHE